MMFEAKFKTIHIRHQTFNLKLKKGLSHFPNQLARRIIQIPNGSPTW